MAEIASLAWRQYRLERKLFWRNPSAAFFNFLLPLLFLALFGAILHGNQHDLNVIVPGIAGMAVMATTFTALAYNMVFLREQGVLKRIHGTPMPGISYLTGIAANAVTNAALQIIIITIAGRLFFGTGWPKDWAELVLFVSRRRGLLCVARRRVLARDPELRVHAGVCERRLLAGDSGLGRVLRRRPRARVHQGDRGGAAAGAPDRRSIGGDGQRDLDRLQRDRAGGDRALGGARDRAGGARLQLGAAAGVNAGVRISVRSRRADDLHGPAMLVDQTMATALLYDIHGNLPALEAVLADANADRFVLGGDYALFGPWPAETVAALRALPDATWIRGNVDRWTAAPAQAPDSEIAQGAIAACRAALGDQLVAELAALPEQIVLDGTRYCHASPISDVRSFMPEPTEDEQELLGDVSEPRLVFGHTHLPFRRVSESGIELLNPGSVGMPFDGDVRAAYALRHDDGSIEQRRVAYDFQASAAAVRERFGHATWTETISRRISTASL